MFQCNSAKQKSARIPPQTSSARTKCKNKISRARISPRHTARILGGQNPERKTPFPFSKCIHPLPRESEMQGAFFLAGLPSEARRWRGVLRAYDLVLIHHALRACLIRDSAGNESELFGIMTTNKQKAPTVGLFVCLWTQGESDSRLGNANAA